MDLRTGLYDKKKMGRTMMLRTGLVFLLLANLAHWFMRPTAFLGEGMLDGILGVLYGVSFGCLLMSIRMAHKPSADGTGN